jgi:hypothetical protein
MKHPYGACTPPVVRAAVAGIHRDRCRRAGDMTYREHKYRDFCCRVRFLKTLGFPTFRAGRGDMEFGEFTHGATTRRRRFGWLGQAPPPAVAPCAMRRRPAAPGQYAEGRNSRRNSHGPERGETKRRRRPGHQRTPHAARFLVGPGACVRARPPRRPTRLTLQPRSQHCP